MTTTTLQKVDPQVSLAAELAEVLRTLCNHHRTGRALALVRTLRDVHLDSQTTSTQDYLVDYLGDHPDLREIYENLLERNRIRESLPKIDIDLLKGEMRELAHLLKVQPADKTGDPRVIRYTKLCALRATMRGRMHFSDRTNLAEACHIFGVPCLQRTQTSSVKGEPSIHYYMPITPDMQREWIDVEIEEFRCG